MVAPQSQIDFIKSEIVAAAAGDKESELLLRGFVARCASNVPLNALLELCETLVTIRERDYRKSQDE